MTVFIAPVLGRLFYFDSQRARCPLLILNELGNDSSICRELRIKEVRLPKENMRSLFYQGTLSTGNRGRRGGYRIRRKYRSVRRGTAARCRAFADRRLHGPGKPWIRFKHRVAVQTPPRYHE